MFFTERSLAKMIVLMLITFGLYIIYWLFVTRNEFNRAGAQVPTAWLFFLPIANFYFLYKFAQAYSRLVLKDESQALLNFLLIVFLIPAAVVVYQLHMNEFNEKNISPLN